MCAVSSYLGCIVCCGVSVLLACACSCLVRGCVLCCFRVMCMLRNLSMRVFHRIMIVRMLLCRCHICVLPRWPSLTVCRWWCSAYGVSCCVLFLIVRLWLLGYVYGWLLPQPHALLLLWLRGVTLMMIVMVVMITC